MKQKLIIIALLLFSALGYSQHQVEIRGNKFYLTDTSDPNDKVEGDNQYDVEAKEGRGGRIFLFSNDRRIHSSVGYDWTEFLDPTGNPFASEDAVFAWFDVNTGNKSGGGSTSGQTAPQVQSAITTSQNAQNTQIANDYVPKADLATAADITAGTSGKLVDAAQLAANVPTIQDASETDKGIVELATDAEATTGTSTTLVPTVKQVKDAIDAIPAAVDASETVKGAIEIATAAEAATGTDATKAVTPLTLKTELDKKTSTVAGASDVDDAAKAEFTTLVVKADGNHQYLDDRIGRWRFISDADWALLPVSERNRYNGNVDVDQLIASGSTDDQTGAEVSFSPAAGVAATNVQAAIEEVAASGGGGTATTDAGNLTSGILPDARVSESSITQHQEALMIRPSQIGEDLGNSIVVEGDMNVPAAWSTTNTVISGGVATLSVPNGGFTSLSQAIALDDAVNPETGYQTGMSYRLSFEITAGTNAVGNQVVFRDKIDGLGDFNETLTINAGTETVTREFEATSNTNGALFARATGGVTYDFSIDNVSIQKLPVSSLEAWNRADIVVFGTSISSDINPDRWVDTFQSLISPEKLTKMAVSGQKITWDPTTTASTTTSSNNSVQNRFWNSILYWESVKTTEPTAFIIELGTNDSAEDLGSYADAFAQDEASTSQLTMANAFRKGIHKLRENYPDTQIIYISPIQSKTGGRSYDILKNIRDINFAICERYAVQRLDAFTESGVSDEFEPLLSAGQYLFDGVHPNAAGAKKIGEYVAKNFKSLYEKGYNE